MLKLFINMIFTLKYFLDLTTKNISKLESPITITYQLG